MRQALTILLLLFSSLTALAHEEKWDDNKRDWSDLMLAIYNGQTEKFTKLIDRGVDVNFIAPGNFKLTALGVAIRTDNETAVNTLLQTSRISKPETYLMTACAQKSALIINQLIKYGANPNDTLENGYSVLMMAASFGSYEVIDALLKHGADTRQTRKVDGMTALMFAVFNGGLDKVKLLLQSGADKYSRDINGKTAIDYVDQIYEHLKVSERTKKELKDLLK